MGSPSLWPSPKKPPLPPGGIDIAPLQKDVTRTSLCCRHFFVFSSLILEPGRIFNCPGRLPMQMDLPATSPPHIFIMFTIHSSSSLPHISIILAHILTKSIRFWRGKTWSKGDGGPDNYYNNKKQLKYFCVQLKDGVDTTEGGSTAIKAGGEGLFLAMSLLSMLL